jgi:uncharacterized protein
MKKIISLLLTLLICAGDNARPAAVGQAQQQQSEAPRYQGYRAPRFTELTLRSLYITMRDGVKIAIDVVLPKDLPEGEKLPALMHLTRYLRAREGAGPNDQQRFFAQHGYAIIYVDVRGTGASFGVWSIPWSKDELKDAGEIVDWITNQPWSNGKVGAFGNSYSGTTAQLLAVTNRPAVRAVVARHYEFDVYTNISFPGGIFNDWMVKNWNESNHQLDLNPGAMPVQEDKDLTLVRAALKEHAGNIDLYKAAKQINYRDDQWENTNVIDDFSVYNFHKEIESSKVAINNWGSWLDAGTADAVIKSFLTLSNTHRSIIGAWNHGASQNASPYLSQNPPIVLQRYEWLRFFDHHLKGIDTGVTLGKELIYYTMGEERWKSTEVWPVEGSSSQRWYMDNRQTLSTEQPSERSGEDNYTIDFEASTGEKNRWRTQLGGPVVYPDRAQEDGRLLTYTSEKLKDDVEITGYPVVSLQVSSTHSDGAFYVYLEEVDEAGKVTYITEGQLRAIHRKISTDVPYQPAPAYHSFRRKDALPLKPGEIAELRFALLPISVLIKKGHRIRVAIAGHDKSVFARVPAEGTPTIRIARNRDHTSFIELPVVARSSRAADAKLLTVIGSNPSQRVAIKLNAAILGSYEGQFKSTNGAIITIERADDHLLLTREGINKLALFPETETKFFFKTVDAQLSFIKDGKGIVTGLIVIQNGNEVRAEKVK